MGTKGDSSKRKECQKQRKHARDRGGGRGRTASRHRCIEVGTAPRAVLGRRMVADGRARTPSCPPMTKGRGLASPLPCVHHAANGKNFPGPGSRPSGFGFGCSGSGSDPGPAPEPEYLNQGPEARDLGPESDPANGIFNSAIDAVLDADIDSAPRSYFPLPGALSTTFFILRKISRRRSRGQPKLRRT